MQKQISIIIPTYNMEAYIGKCLDSLLIPEIDDVEVWVVNDGSKDRSSEIAHGYAERYPVSIHVLDKPNGNYGSCINAALPRCTGRYIKILDADDTFDTVAFSEYVKNLRRIDTDLLLNAFDLITEDGYVTETIDYDLSAAMPLDVTTTAEAFINGRACMHGFAYHRRVFERFEYKQTEGISYTDTEWVMIPLIYVESVTYLNIVLYKYLVGRVGQTMSVSEFARNIDHLMIAVARIVAANDNYRGDWEHAIDVYMAERFRMIYHCCLLENYPYKNDCLVKFDNSIRAGSKKWGALADGLIYSMPFNQKLSYVVYWYKHGRKPDVLLLRLRKAIASLKAKLR